MKRKCLTEVILLALFILNFQVILSAKEKTKGKGLSINKIGVKLSGLTEDSGSISRFSKFSYFPKNSLSLSEIEIGRNTQSFNFKIGAKDLGEQDSSADLLFTISKLFIGTSDFSKIPYKSSTTDWKQRTFNDFKFSFLPVNNYSLYGYTSNEDKVGLEDDSGIGQKTKVYDVELAGELGINKMSIGNISVDYTRTNLKSNEYGFWKSATTGSFIRDGENYNFSASLKNSKIDSEITDVNGLSINEFDMLFQYDVSDMVSVSAAYDRFKSKDDNSEAESLDTNSYSLGADVFLMNSSVSLGYTRKNKDFTNSDINGQSIDIFDISAKSKVKDISLSGSYKNENRKVSGINNASLFSTNLLPEDKLTASFKISKNFKKANLAYTIKYEKEDFDRVIINSVDKKKTMVQSFSAGTSLSDKINLIYSYNLLEWELDGDGLTVPNEAAPYTLAQNDETHTIGLDVLFTQQTNAGIMYSYTKGNSSELFGSDPTNEIKEKVFTLNVGYKLNDLTEVKANFNYNDFNQTIPSSFNGKSSLYELELIRKF